ncbi:MAG: hypothetical protein KKA73_19590 [Chloroflexi bacterium]|nr:hypothetical protein [Chloroflexota bacterium]MBU1749891.1 hypothetical protein [Chloroflexota bacterium]
MKTRYVGLLIVLLLSVLLAGCDVRTTASPTPAVAGSDWGYTSAYLQTSYPEALPVVSQLTLGTLKLEGTGDTVTPAQAQALLPLWQSLQGNALRDNAERSAVLAAIEKGMTPAQLQAIAALQLTQTDLRSWMESQGLSFGPPGGTPEPGASTDARATAQAQFGTMTEAEREAMRATAQAGGGFAGGGQRGGQGSGQWTGGGRPNAGGGVFGPMLDPLIELLTQRAAE